MRSGVSEMLSTKFRTLCHLNFVHASWAWVSQGRHEFFRYRHIYTPILHEEGLTFQPIMHIIWLSYMASQKPSSSNAKAAALREAGALHPRPESIEDELFSQHEFFDRRDRVQTKYEMLRRHQVDGKPVVEAAKSFGVSRQAFYKTASIFKSQGAPGLLPRRRGPKGGHKCTNEVLDFAEQWRSGAEAQSGSSLVEAVRRRFGVNVHPRTIERALAKRKKKRRGKMGSGA